MHSEEPAKADIPEKHQNILSYTKISNKVNISKNLFRFAHNWNGGKMEYWARSEAFALYWVCIASY